MTGCIADNTEDAAVFAKHAAIAQASNVPFVSINFVWDSEDRQCRTVDPTRYEETKLKLHDTKILQMFF